MRQALSLQPGRYFIKNNIIIGILHKMLGLHDNGLAAVARNSIQCLSEGDATSEVGASSETPCCRLSAGGVAFGAIGGGFAAEEQGQCTQEIAKQND
ncbi:hypothetical protein NC652_022565 [Populus alba x Populus x berolinensis]|nr:hypothetical protein NC652_022565 [Populus alba x Populus x berolinensis]